eukprot:TRINITY_DN33914_c0_g1_i1.p1 TRINITY_DN33914_c0_g1~~TRINITY_DN33914_c0_g1_i1.p1  ORF type:complete len:558 (-),score=108.91 TRINITY_DN33914_c0_g1_i1:222-1895(-)
MPVPGQSRLGVPGQQPGGQSQGTTASANAASAAARRERRRKKLSNNILLLDGHGNSLGRFPLRTVLAHAKSLRAGEMPYEPPTPTGGRPGAFPAEGLATQEQVEEGSLLSHQSFHVVGALERQASAIFESASACEVLRYLDSRWGAQTPGEFRHAESSELAQFATSFKRVITESIALLKREPLLVQLASPLYVFGDIHGNFADMHFFLRELVSFGDLKYTAHGFLFLGDYVDRGAHSVETIAYLLALKVLAPGNVAMLRGNHESPEVNGDVLHYGAQSFRRQCQMLFAPCGPEVGEEIWRECNKVFTYLPICATIDSKIFCVHGGLPRFSGGEDRRLQVLRDDTSFPRFAVVQAPPTVNEDPPTRMYRQITNDLLWSDPAEDEDAEATLDEFGFGENPRGPGTISFGARAVDTFLENTGFDLIFRAHQEKCEGLKLAKSGRVVTIFSTSDYSGHNNGAGIVFVSRDRIRMIIKRPYREPPPPIRQGMQPLSIGRPVAAGRASDAVGQGGAIIRGANDVAKARPGAITLPAPGVPVTERGQQQQQDRQAVMTLPSVGR